MSYMTEQPTPRMPPLLPPDWQGTVLDAVDRTFQVALEPGNALDTDMRTRMNA